MKFLKYFLCFVLFIFLTHPVFAASQTEDWIIYFQSNSDATNFKYDHPNLVKGMANNILKVSDTEQELNLYEKKYSIQKVELNQTKSTDSITNDLYIEKQWGLNAVNFSSVIEHFPKKSDNLLLGKKLTVGSDTFSYNGESFLASAFTINLNGTDVNRLSVTLDHVEGNWSLIIKSSSGSIFAQNTGSTPRLDVLLKDTTNLSGIVVNILPEKDWTTSPKITNLVGVKHILIGVIDTGVSQHTDFCDNILYSLGKNYIDTQAPPLDDVGHGTHVTGIIAACTNNSIGVSGVTGNAPVDIIPFKALNKDGEGDDFTISMAINSAVNLGVNVINLSLAGQGKTTMMEQAIKNAYAKNVVVVAAAGNWNTATDNVYPASYPEVITVSGINSNLQKVDSSNYGWQVDISAPGENVLNTYLNNQYAYLTGTSMATPFITGAAALLKVEDPQMSVVKLRSKLFHSTKDILDAGYDIKSGYGIVDFSKLFSSNDTKSLEWLSLKEGQPLTTDSQTIGYDSFLIGKDIYVFKNEQLVFHKIIDSLSDLINLSAANSNHKNKIYTIVSYGSKIYSVNQLFLTITNSENTSTFADVDQNNWAYQEINDAASLGLINGYGDNTFKPDNNITRVNAAMMMNRLLRWDRISSIKSPFIDLKGTIDIPTLSVLSAYNENVIYGYPDGTFKPNNFLTRGQMALILARALNMSDDLQTSSTYHFSDVPLNAEIFIPIQNLANAGIINKQSNFNPSNFITRAQFAAMVDRAYKYLHKEK